MDFFSHWTGGKVKIWIEKSAVNTLKPTGGKNQKAWQAVLHGKPWLDLYFVYRKQWMEIKITEYVICLQEAF